MSKKEKKILKNKNNKVNKNIKEESNKNAIIVEWIIVKRHGKNYDVIINDKLTATLILKWKLKRSKLQFIEGDKVKVELNEIDPTKGYIIERL